MINNQAAIALGIATIDELKHQKEIADSILLGTYGLSTNYPDESGGTTIQPTHPDNDDIIIHSEPGVYPTITTIYPIVWPLPTIEPPIVIDTDTPTTEPTEVVTDGPTIEPTTEPTEVVTDGPTIKPTTIPTTYPTVNPTVFPTIYPTSPSDEPSSDPSDEPTISPTICPPPLTSQPRPVDPIIDIPEGIDEEIPSKNPFNNIDVITKLETLEKSITYWADIINNRHANDDGIDFYEQKDTFKTFDFFTYSIDNSYLSKMYDKLYDSFANARRFNQDSNNLVRTFSEYAFANGDTKAIVFEGLKENDINVINCSYEGKCTYSSLPLNVYLKHIQLTNEDLYFKTSSNVSIDYDGNVHFFNNTPAYITAYSTAKPSIKKTVCVLPNYVEYIPGEIEVKSNGQALPNNVTLTMVTTNLNSLQLPYTNAIFSPRSYGNYTGEFLIDFKPDVIELDKSHNYICKIGNLNSKSRFVAAKSDFSSVIEFDRVIQQNLIYGTVKIIDAHHAKFFITANELTFASLQSRSFIVKIVDNETKKEASFKATFVCKKVLPMGLIKPKVQLINPLEIEVESGKYYNFYSFGKQGVVLAGNSKYNLRISDNSKMISSLYIANSTGGISTIVPKAKITGERTAEIISIGKGSFDIFYSLYDISDGSIASYSDSFIVQELKVSHSPDNVKLTHKDGKILVKLQNSDTIMAPITIIAQYNSYEKNNEFIKKNLVNGFKTKYLYDKDTNINDDKHIWAEIEIDAPDVKKEKIPVRIYFISFDNVIFYKDWSPAVMHDGEFHAPLRTEGKFVDYLGNEYAKNLSQPLYNIGKENKISPFMKVSLGLSDLPFINEITDAPSSYVALRYKFATDVASKTNGMPLTIAQQKRILAIESSVSSSYSYSPYMAYVMNHQVNEYLISQGFAVNETVYKPSNLSYISIIKDSASLSISSESTAMVSPIYAIDSIKDFDNVKVWNVIPSIKIENPAVKHTITEHYGRIRSGCFYRTTEKNYDITLDKNSLFDTDFPTTSIEISITEKDSLVVTFQMELTNIMSNGQLKSIYMINENTIYVNGKLDGKEIESKYLSNCSRNFRTGELSVSSLSKNSFTIIVSSKGSRKRISLTFAIDEYDIVDDNLLIDINPELTKIEQCSYLSNTCIGQYMQNAYVTMPQGKKLKNVWLSSSSLSENYGSFKSNFLSSSPLHKEEGNAYVLCDIDPMPNNACVLTKRYITTEQPSILSYSFMKDIIRMPLDLSTIYLTDEYYNELMKNAVMMQVAKDYEYELCIDAKQILSRYKLFNNDNKIANIEIETSNDGIDYVYDKANTDTKVKLSSIKISIHALCKNKLILLHSSIPIASSFKFCYNDIFAKYGHINGLLISDKNNNPIYAFHLDVSFEPYVKANIVTKRIYDMPVLFFDDASSQMNSNRDYDNLLPNFTLYRDKLTDESTKEGKIGYLSSLDYESFGQNNYDYTLCILNKLHPMILHEPENDIEGDKSSPLECEYSYDEKTLKPKILGTLVVGTTNKTYYTPYSMKYVGYFMYYMNMNYLKRLKWLSLSDSEDIIYYLILLDKLSNSSSSFYDFKNNQLDKVDFEGIRNIHLFSGTNFKLSFDYIAFFKKNYDAIAKEWNDRIDAYQLMISVLEQYDPALTIIEQIDKYLSNISSKNKYKAEKIYCILTEKSITNNYVESWAVSQISNRIWDNTSMHFIWKNVFKIMFEDQFDFSIINDAILRDIYNYGFYPTINVPETGDSNVYIPYMLDVDGQIKPSFDGKNYIWNVSQNPIYEYITNGNRIIGIKRTFSLKTPIFKTWSLQQVPTVLPDENGNCIYEYTIENEIESGWGTLMCKGVEYSMNIKHKIKKANLSKQKVLHKISYGENKMTPIAEVLNNWIPLLYKAKDLNGNYTIPVEDKPELGTQLEYDGDLSNCQHSILVKKNSFSNKHYMVEGIKLQDSECYMFNESKYPKVDYSFVIDNWKPNAFYCKNSIDSEFVLLNEKPEESSKSTYEYAIKNTFYSVPDDLAYFAKPAYIKIERLIGTEYKYIVNYTKPDFSNYWIDEDKTNLIKMNQSNLVEAMKVQKFLAELFLSELNKTTNMINCLLLFKDMKRIVGNINESWGEMHPNAKTQLEKDYIRLLDFNVNTFLPLSNCIYPSDTKFIGAYSYSYAYYDGNNHLIANADGVGNVSIDIPITSAKMKYSTKFMVNDDMVECNLIIPQNNITPKPTANVSIGTINGISYVKVVPINNAEGIEPFGIYPWNANKKNFSYIHDGDNIYSMPASWANSFTDLTGLQNYKDYKSLSKYQDIDPDGWKNSMLIMNSVFSGKIMNCPAVSLAYNFYPEEALGIKKHSIACFTYDFVSYTQKSLYSDNLVNTFAYIEKLPANCIEFSISSYDLHLYPRTNIINYYEYSSTEMSNICSYTCSTYEYSYLTSSIPTYSVAYSCVSYEYSYEWITYNKQKNSTYAYLQGVSELSSCFNQILDLGTTKPNMISLSTSSYETFITNSSTTLSDLLANGTTIEDNELLTTKAGEYAYEISAKTFNSEYNICSANFSYMSTLRAYLSHQLNALNAYTYVATIKRNIPVTSYTVMSKVKYDCKEKDVNRDMYNSYSFFLGSVSQWQVVQDNVKEINNKLADIHNHNKELSVPDYFYDGRIDRNVPSAKLFWTSSEIDALNAWMMFFDKKAIKNNSKNCSAYIRPFIRIQ